MYKLKHVPTGLYYQPHRHRGSNFSKRGKIYQTSTHGLSSAIKQNKENFTVYVNKDSLVYKLSKDILQYRPCPWAYKQVKADTNINDWVIEIID